MAFHVWTESYVGVIALMLFICATDISHTVMTHTSRQSLYNFASNHVVLL